MMECHEKTNKERLTDRELEPLGRRILEICSVDNTAVCESAVIAMLGLGLQQSSAMLSQEVLGDNKVRIDKHNYRASGMPHAQVPRLGCS